MATVNVGVDIGQKRDATAVAVAELEYREREVRREDHWLVRHLERLPLGTPYPQVADRLSEIVENVRKQENTVYETDALGGRWRRTERPQVSAVYADATGVGQPVVDELRARGLPVTACYFTHGDRRTVEGHTTVKIGKAWLVSRLQALAQSKRIHLPRTPEALAMERELMDYEIRIGPDANDRYGAFKVGSHDDLVTALGLAVQAEPFNVLIARV